MPAHPLLRTPIRISWGVGPFDKTLRRCKAAGVREMVAFVALRTGFLKLGVGRGGFVCGCDWEVGVWTTRGGVTVSVVFNVERDSERKQGRGRGMRRRAVL